MAAGAGTFLFGPKEVKLDGTPGKVPMTNVITATAGGAAIGALLGYFARTDTWLAVSPGR